MTKLLGLGLLAGVLLSTSLAHAIPNLKFDDGATPGGTVSYDGAGGPAIGTDIIFTTITGIDTPANAGVELACTGCLLNFETGNNVSEGPALWNFGPGGTITVTGAVAALGLPAGTTLLSGTFSGTPNEIQAGVLGLFAAGGVDVKDPILAAFFGLTPDFVHATTSIQAPLTVGADASFTGPVVNADLNNLQIPVPVPATGLLLGLGLLLMGLPSALRRVAV
jgi:hypothetical protein